MFQAYQYYLDLKERQTGPGSNSAKQGAGLVGHGNKTYSSGYRPLSSNPYGSSNGWQRVLRDSHYTHHGQGTGSQTNMLFAQGSNNNLKLQGQSGKFYKHVGNAGGSSAAVVGTNHSYTK